MQQQKDTVYLHRNLNKHRSSERMHCEVSYDEDMVWYGRGAAGVLGIGARATNLVQPVRNYDTAVLPDFSRRGLSGRAFIAVVLTVAMLLFIPVANTLITMTARGKAVGDLETSIQSVTQKISDQQAELAKANSQYDVQYLAAQMGMHAATSRDTVYLTIYGN